MLIVWGEKRKFLKISILKDIIKEINGIVNICYFNDLRAAIGLVIHTCHLFG